MNWFVYQNYSTRCKAITKRIMITLLVASQSAIAEVKSFFLLLKEMRSDSLTIKEDVFGWISLFIIFNSIRYKLFKSSVNFVEGNEQLKIITYLLVLMPPIILSYPTPNCFHRLLSSPWGLLKELSNLAVNIGFLIGVDYFSLQVFWSILSFNLFTKRRLFPK